MPASRPETKAPIEICKKTKIKKSKGMNTFSLFVIFLDILIFYKIYRNKMYDLYKPINYLGIFIILQIILGIFTVLYGAQIYVASMHQISTIFLVSSSIYFIYLNTKFN